MATDEQKRKVGENIKAKMRERGLNQTQLAAKAHVTQASVSNYVRGKSDLTVGTLSRIANALDCTFDDLLEGVL